MVKTFDNYFLGMMFLLLLLNLSYALDNHFLGLDDTIVVTDDLIFQPISLYGSHFDGKTIPATIAFKKPGDDIIKKCGNKNMDEDSV